MSSLSAEKYSSYDVANARLISKMRVVLAAATLFVIYIDPSEPQRFVALTYTILIAYTVYAVFILLSPNRDQELPILKYAYWMDIGWCLLLIATSGGTNSIFFFLFFFSILNASFRFGFREGLRVVIISAILFTVVGYLFAPSGADFELNRFLLRPVYLSVLGYMVAYWGERELAHKKRLEALRNINNLYNPRFGIDQTTSAIMQKILVSFDADSCLMITNGENSPAYFLRQSYRDNPESAIHAEQIKSDHLLNSIADEYAVIYCQRKSILKRRESYSVFDLINDKRIEQPTRNGEILADFLETDSLISVPLFRRETAAGRIYLTAHGRDFDYSDIEFLLQLLNTAVPVLDNINLLDRLASEATAQQRQKISRDIHDSTIQPYIGIKFGLEALQIKEAAGENVSDDIVRLIEIAETNITDVRSYINRLKSNASGVEIGNTLIAAIKQQAKKLSEFYAIEIEVTAEENMMNISDRLAAEVFQIVTEGLSNIKRHTKADRALIILKRDNASLRLNLKNNNTNGAVADQFIPKSISGRARSLGGQVSVTSDGKETDVMIEIPL